jgi:hypothetical protein
MTAFYFYPQIQDTILAPQQPDTSVIIHRPHVSGSNLRVDSAVQQVIRPVLRLEKPAEVISKESVIDSNAPGKVQPEWNRNKNFFSENGLSGMVGGFRNDSTRLTATNVPTRDHMPVERFKFTDDWLFGVFIFLIVLFVWIRIFYSKFFAALANALVSFHLSAKLFEERNVLLQRVSIVLDFIYIVVFSIFVFEWIDYHQYSGPRMSGFNLFLLLINILMIYTLLRIVVLRLVGSLFLVRPLFLEYIHNTFVINKGLGIILFPMVIMAQYLPYKIIPVVLWLGIIALGAGILFKAIRAYQIIIRRDILLFYLILYLCTLEILPLLLGYKFVTTLIQSN